MIAAIRLTLPIQLLLHKVQLLERVKSLMVLVCFDLNVFTLFCGHLFIMVEGE